MILDNITIWISGKSVPTDSFLLNSLEFNNVKYL